MKLFIWRHVVGTIAVAHAENKKSAIRSLKKASKDMPKSVLDGFDAYEPEVYETQKAFTLWADVYDLDEE